MDVCWETHKQLIFWIKNTSRTNSLPLFHSLSYKLVADIIRRNKSGLFRSPPIQKGCMGASDNICVSEWRVFRSSAKQGQELGKWGRFLKGLGPTTAFSHTQDTVGCKKSYQFPAVRCIQPFHCPLLFSTT